MKGPESIFRNAEEAWKSREEAEHRDRFREYDFMAGDPISAIQYRPAHRIALQHFNVTIVNVLNSRVTRFTYPVLAYDRDHAEFMALAYHRGTPAETYYVENKL